MDLVMEHPTGAELAQWEEHTRERLTRLREGNVPGDAAAVTDAFLAGAVEGDGLADGHFVGRFVDDGTTVGSVRLRDRGITGVVVDLDVPVDRLPEVLDRLRAAAPSHGWTSLTVSAYPGDPVGAAIRDGGADLVATKMGRALADVPDADIELRPMLDERFARFIDEGVESYAHSIFEAGDYPTIEDARLSSLEQHKQLLPQGLQSPGHLLWSAFDPAEPTQEVGLLWIEERLDHGFIFEIEVDQAHQRKGYGTQMLRAGAAQMRERGRKMLWLNVFGHNADARRLYEREGYAVNEEILRIVVEPPVAG